MKYRLKNAETEAVQWDGSEEALEAIRRMFPEHEPINTIPHVLIAGVGFYSGQWIFPDLSRMNDDEFHELYEPVTEPETCVWELKPDANRVNGDKNVEWYSTDCREFEHTPSDGRMTYCPKCGRKIEERE